MDERGRRCLHPFSRVHGLVLVGGLLGGSACSDQPTGDDFGPASGVAVVEGTVTERDGTPVGGGMDVVLTRCAPPIGGLAGSGQTGADGSYRVEGALPPIGMPEGQDSLLVSCELIAGAGFAESGELDVFFFRPPADPTPLEVTLSGS